MRIRSDVHNIRSTLCASERSIQSRGVKALPAAARCSGGGAQLPPREGLEFALTRRELAFSSQLCYFFCSFSSIIPCCQAGRKEKEGLGARYLAEGGFTVFSFLLPWLRSGACVLTKSQHLALCIGNSRQQCSPVQFYPNIVCMARPPY